MGYVNPKAWMAALVGKPMIITSVGTYVTRIGEIVVIDKPSYEHDFKCYGTYVASGKRDSWHHSGRLYFGAESDNDIVRKA